MLSARPTRPPRRIMYPQACRKQPKRRLTRGWEGYEREMHTEQVVLPQFFEIMTHDCPTHYATS